MLNAIIHYLSALHRKTKAALDATRLDMGRLEKFGTIHTVDSVTAALAAQVQALRDLAVHHDKEVARHVKLSDDHEDAADRHDLEKLRAERIAAKINDLIEG